MQLKMASSVAALMLLVGMAASPVLAQQSSPSTQPGLGDTAAPSRPGATGQSTVGPKYEAVPFKGQILEQSAESYLASDLIGANVDAKDRPKIGKVEDLIVRPDGGIDGVIVSVGGFLGIGDRDVALKLGDARIRDTLGKLTVQLPVSAEELSKAPPFKTKAKIETEKKIEMQRQERKPTSGGQPM
jgi:hypothetical protein